MKATLIARRFTNEYYAKKADADDMPVIGRKNVEYGTPDDLDAAKFAFGQECGVGFFTGFVDAVDDDGALIFSSKVPEEN